MELLCIAGWIVGLVGWACWYCETAYSKVWIRREAERAQAYAAEVRVG